MLSEHQRNLTLEWVKLIAAYFVVCIHVLLPGNLGAVFDCIGRFAVPVFFAISGYYAMGADCTAIGRKIRRTLVLALLSNALYFAQGVWIWNVYGGSLMDYCRDSISTYSVSSLLLTGAPLFVGYHLWFLSSLLFCYAVLYVYIRFFEHEAVPYQYLYCFSACMLAGFFYADSLMDLQGAIEINEVVRNGLFLGLPCFSLGLFLREHRQRIIRAFRWNEVHGLILMGIGFLLSLLQYFGTGKAELPLGMMLVVPELLLLCIQNPETPDRNSVLGRMAPWAGKLSVWVFLLHIFVQQIIVNLQDRSPVAAWMCSEEGAIPLTVWVILFTTVLGIAACILSSLAGARVPKRSQKEPR